MGLFVSNDETDGSGSRPGADWLVIDRVSYPNTAAKFWSRLVDEVMLAFPTCDCVELAGVDDRALDPRHLHPETQLARDAERLRTADLAKLLEAMLAEIKLFGPPPPVRVSICRGQTVIKQTTLPAECLDSSVFAVLLVWLLVWARIPASRWGAEFLDGEFTAEDVRREYTYAVRFELHNRQGQEGLVEHCLRFYWQRS